MFGSQIESPSQTYSSFPDSQYSALGESFPPTLPPARSFSIVEDGVLHVAFDRWYQGSIDSYTNVFSRFFAWLFRFSTVVVIDGKNRSVNKKSYLAFLKSIGGFDGSKAKASNYKNLSQIIGAHHRSDCASSMAQHLSPSKIRSLTSKMIRALREKNGDRLHTYLGKGANPNQFFWHRAYDQRTLFFPGEGKYAELAPTAIQPTSISLYTPLLYAAREREQSLTSLLRHFGANQHAQGEAGTIERKILHVRTDAHVEYNPRTVVHVRHTHKGDRAIVREVPGFDQCTTTIVTFEDTYVKTHMLYFDGRDTQEHPIAPQKETRIWHSTDSDRARIW
jgi:hypothetical protein